MHLLQSSHFEMVAINYIDLPRYTTLCYHFMLKRLDVVVMMELGSFSPFKASLHFWVLFLFWRLRWFTNSLLCSLCTCNSGIDLPVSLSARGA